MSGSSPLNGAARSKGRISAQTTAVRYVVGSLRSTGVPGLAGVSTEMLTEKATSESSSSGRVGFGFGAASAEEAARTAPLAATPRAIVDSGRAPRSQTPHARSFAGASWYPRGSSSRRRSHSIFGDALAPRATHGLEVSERRGRHAAQEDADEIRTLDNLTKRGGCFRLQRQSVNHSLRRRTQGCRPLSACSNVSALLAARRASPQLTPRFFSRRMKTRLQCAVGKLVMLHHLLLALFLDRRVFRRARDEQIEGLVVQSVDVRHARRWTDCKMQRSHRRTPVIKKRHLRCFLQPGLQLCTLARPSNLAQRYYIVLTFIIVGARVFFGAQSAPSAVMSWIPFASLAHNLKSTVASPMLQLAIGSSRCRSRPRP